MFQISKKFSIPVGHRLSKHQGKCKNIHGHNMDVIITVGSEILNDNDMVMDFADLKIVVNEILDKFDHSLMLNFSTDGDLFRTLFNSGIKNVQPMGFEPTAERFAEFLFKYLEDKFPKHVSIQSVEIFENDTSSAKYFR